MPSGRVNCPFVPATSGVEQRADERSIESYRGTTSARKGEVDWGGGRLGANIEGMAVAELAGGDPDGRVRSMSAIVSVVSLEPESTTTISGTTVRGDSESSAAPSVAASSRCVR